MPLPRLADKKIFILLFFFHEKNQQQQQQNNNSKQNKQKKRTNNIESGLYNGSIELGQWYVTTLPVILKSD